jgi:hypothetical protein
MAAPRKPIRKKMGTAKGTLLERMGEAKNRPYKGTRGGVPARVQKVRGNPNLARPQESIRMGGTGGTGRSVATVKAGLPARVEAPSTGKALTVAKETAKTTARVGLRGLLGAGSAVVGMVTESRPAGSAAERAWERRNTEQRRMKGRVSGMAFNKATQPSPKGGGPRSRQGSQAPSMRAGTTVAGRPETPGAYMPQRKAAGVNQMGMAKKNAAAKAKPKRRTNLERMRRRQAERFAISSSGRSL